jgi:hypothetical protein
VNRYAVVIVIVPQLADIYREKQPLSAASRPLTKTIWLFVTNSTFKNTRGPEAELPALWQQRAKT